MKSYDAIVIGSGIGGLTVASLLAQRKRWRVLVLERHFRAGGFTHEFRRRHYHWEVGLHYVGEMQRGSMMRRLMDLVTAGQVDWDRMPEPFEKFVYPDFTFALYGDEERFVAELCALFPAEAAAIHRYLADVKAAAVWFGRHFTLSSPESLLAKWGHLVDAAGSVPPEQRTGEYLQARFRDPKLRALLASQWGDYGLPPAHSAFVVHALIVAHYLSGGYFPVGGAGRIADAVVQLVESAGGEILVSHEATEILIEDGRAVGVRARRLPQQRDSLADEPLEFRAPRIISDTGVHTTFLKLVPDSQTLPLRQGLRSFYRGLPVASSVTLYLGLSADPRTLGFRGENYWIFSSYDHDQSFAAGKDWIPAGAVPGVFLSFPSLKNPHSAGHTAELIANTDYDSFAKWSDAAWKKRGPDYEAMKDRIAQALLSFVEDRLPGLRALVDYYELSTPITSEHFTGHARGAMYGLSCVPERFAPEVSAFCRARTLIPGLYLTGSDVFSPGIAGAMMGGFACLSELLGGFTVRSLMRGKAA